ncbi:hypothetical protein BDM02DRAFT_3029199 [Thelephora ganbajun]|uniref:Uncharacterized protein n=1 Tax=Thelephora ganbajun TaxID=370292 RepID=A0ACB6ZAI6_THEGA|nr:hypothetical protein BDM02DRAFT_3029199 [Thelephora ganbajun]
MNSQIREKTPAQRLPRRPHSNSSVSVTAEASSRKRKRPSEPPDSEAEPDHLSQPPTDNRPSERLSQTSQPSSRLRMECVLITTLPPAWRRKPAPPETSEDEDEDNLSRASTGMRGREKQRGKQREVVSTSRASVRSDSRSLADNSLRSLSHSVSSFRRPLFEPETSPQADSGPIEVEEPTIMVEQEDVDDSGDEISVSFVSHQRKRVESQSPTSVDLPPPSSSASSPLPDKPPHYTIVNIKRRQPGSGVRIAPHQHQIAKTPASIYSQTQVHRPVAGPSRPDPKVGPPTYRLPKRLEPKLRPPTELYPPRPPPPHPGLATLEARMNAFVDENQKLRDELVTVKSELAVTRSELTTALARVGAVERGLHGLETLETKLEDMKDNYERLSNLLRGEHLFDSEKFRTAIQTEVKNNFGYYWPSLKSDMKTQLWKECPPPVKEYLEKEMGKVVDEVMLVRSELLAFQQKWTTGVNDQSGDPAITELKQVIERIEKKQEELEATMPKKNITPPHLPPKPPPWPDKPQQGPQRRGSR